MYSQCQVAHNRKPSPWALLVLVPPILNVHENTHLINECRKKPIHWLDPFYIVAVNKKFTTQRRRIINFLNSVRYHLPKGDLRTRHLPMFSPLFESLELLKILQIIRSGLIHSWELAQSLQLGSMFEESGPISHMNFASSALSERGFAPYAQLDLWVEICIK